MPFILDDYGRLHRTAGPGGGQFAPRVSTPPSGQLVEERDQSLFERVLQAKFAALWNELCAAGDSGPVSTATRESVLEAAIRRYTSAEAPVVVEVAPEHAARGAEGPYRAAGDRLMRQVFAHPGTGQEVPPGEGGVPVAAEPAWLSRKAEQVAAELREAGFAARDEHEVQQKVQGELDAYAAVDGEVWRDSRPPVYQVPLTEHAAPEHPAASPDAPEGRQCAARARREAAPAQRVEVVVAPAPDTSEHAALGYYPPGRWEDAVADAEATAQRLGAEPAVPPEPPIKWLAELGLIRESSWREGSRLVFDPSSTLTVETWAAKFQRFREQIAEQLPEAVSGDVGAFQVVPEFRVDRSALTETQWAEYRRYVLFGLEHGLI